MVWGAQHNIEFLEWPTCSPDLNPTHWVIISRRIYQHGKQFAIINEHTTGLDEMQHLVKLTTTEFVC